MNTFSPEYTEKLRSDQYLREKIRAKENLIQFNIENIRFLLGEENPDMAKIEKGKKINEKIQAEIDEIKTKLLF